MTVGIGPFTGNDVADITPGKGFLAMPALDAVVTPCRALWVSVAGVVVIRSAVDASIATLNNVPVGRLEVGYFDSLRTGTTATIDALIL